MRKYLIGLGLAAIVLGLASSAWASDLTWTNGLGDRNWPAGGNWTGGTAGQFPNATTHNAFISDNVAGPIIDAGFGTGGEGAYSLTLYSGTIDVTSTGNLRTKGKAVIGDEAGKTATINIAAGGNADLNFNNTSANNVYIGNTSHGVLNITGTATSLMGVYVGNQAGGVGDVNLSGTYTLNKQLFLGQNSGASGTITVNGGNLIAGVNDGTYTNITVGNNGGTGTINLNSGKFSNVNDNSVSGGGSINLGVNGGTGHLEMSGGQLYAHEIWFGSSGASVHMTGGLMIFRKDIKSVLDNYIYYGGFSTDAGLVINTEWDPNYVWPDEDPNHDLIGTGATLVYITPEPATLVMLALAAIPMLRRRR